MPDKAVITTERDENTRRTSDHLETQGDRKRVNKRHLTSTDPPFLLISTPNEVERGLLETHLYSDQTDLLVRRLRGSKMTTSQELMTEFGASLQFFDGFGENWNALRECLAYMDEWMPAKGYVLVITNPTQLLSREEPPELETFMEIIDDTGKWWSEPITDDGRFNRGRVPFHVILHCGPDEIADCRSIFKSRPVISLQSGDEDPGIAQ